MLFRSGLSPKSIETVSLFVTIYLGESPMQSPASIPDFGDHHLPRHSKFEAALRTIASFLSPYVCGSAQNFVDDLELEEEFERDVTYRRFTPSLVGGTSDLERERNLLMYDRVSTGLQLTYVVEHPDLYQTIMETGEVPLAVPTPLEATLVVVEEDPAEEDENEEEAVDEEDGLGGAQAALGGHTPAPEEERPPLVETEPSLSLTPQQMNQMADVVVRKPLLSRTVAAIIVAIDAKVGVTLDNTESNVLVVERMARKVMRDAGFRDIDVSRHLPQVCECYFVCRENQELAGARRRRVPRWLLKLFGFRSNTTRLRA